MGKIAVIVVFAMLAAAPIALAQPDGGRKPGASAGKAIGRPIDKPVSQARTPTSCAAFGPGFVRAEGSDTCVRIGGSVSIGVGGHAR